MDGCVRNPHLPHSEENFRTDDTEQCIHRVSRELDSLEVLTRLAPLALHYLEHPIFGFIIGPTPVRVSCLAGLESDHLMDEVIQAWVPHRNHPPLGH